MDVFVSYERLPMPQCGHCDRMDSFHAYVYYTCSVCGELVCGRHLVDHTAQHQPPETGERDSRLEAAQRYYQPPETEGDP